MLRLILTCIAICFLGNCFAQLGHVQKVTHDAFTTDGIKKVRFNIDPNKIEVRTTRSTRVLVETSIRMNIDSEPLLDYAIQSGRYAFESEVQGDILLVTPIPQKHVIMVRGEEVEEIISYTIFIPERLEQSTEEAVVVK